MHSEGVCMLCFHVTAKSAIQKQPGGSLLTQMDGLPMRTEPDSDLLRNEPNLLPRLPRLHMSKPIPDSSIYISIHNEYAQTLSTIKGH